MFIRAKSVHQLAGGIYQVHIEQRPLTEAEQLALGTLFPNLIQQAEELLDREAMIASIVFHDEAMRIVKPDHEGKYSAVEVEEVKSKATQKVKGRCADCNEEIYHDANVDKWIHCKANVKHNHIAKPYSL